MRESDRRCKDEKRHGGHRERLLDIFGPRCSVCGVIGDEFGIVAHHITGNPEEHEWQVLLCRSCHAKIHNRGVEKKKIPEKIIRDVITNSSTLEDAAKTLSVTRQSLAYRRKKYGIFKNCRYCQKDFMPTRKLKEYCSVECQSVGVEENYQARIKRVTKDQKRERDRKSYLKHREERIAKVKEHYQANAEKIKAYAREYHRKKKQQ